MSAQVILQSLFNYKASVNEEILAGRAKIDSDTHQSEQHAAIRLQISAAAGRSVQLLILLRP
jgi:hypothetical protein